MVNLGEYMNEDIFSGKWHQFKGKVKEKWGKLTDNDLTKINGKREQLLGALEERYGWQKQKAEEELKKFEQFDHKEEGFSKRESLNEHRHEKKEFNKNELELEEEGGEERPKKRKFG